MNNIDKILILSFVIIVSSLLIAYYTADIKVAPPTALQLGNVDVITELPFQKENSIFDNYSDEQVKDAIDFYNEGAIDTSLSFLDEATSGKIISHFNKGEVNLNKKTIKKLVNILKTGGAIYRLEMGSVKMCIFQPTYTFIFNTPSQDINITFCFSCYDAIFTFTNGHQKFTSDEHSFTAELKGKLESLIKETGLD